MPCKSHVDMREPALIIDSLITGSIMGTRSHLWLSRLLNILPRAQVPGSENLELTPAPDLLEQAQVGLHFTNGRARQWVEEQTLLHFPPGRVE
jgi:hypothetical protein